MYEEHYKDYIALGTSDYLVIVDSSGKRITTLVENVNFHTIEEREQKIKEFANEHYKENKSSPLYVANVGVPVFVDAIEHPLGLVNISKGKRI